MLHSQKMALSSPLSTFSVLWTVAACFRRQRDNLRSVNSMLMCRVSVYYVTYKEFAPNLVYWPGHFQMVKLWRRFSQFYKLCRQAQIPLHGPDETLSETRVYDQVSDKVWLGSDKSADFVWSQTCPFNLDIYGFYPWVWSGRRQSQWVPASTSQ